LFDGSDLGGCGVVLLSVVGLGVGVAFYFGLRLRYAVQMHHPTQPRQRIGETKTNSTTKAKTIIISSITKKSSKIGTPHREVKTRNVATINPERPK
jgi:hypothetical protein